MISVQETNYEVTLILATKVMPVTMSQTSSQVSSAPSTTSSEAISNLSSHHTAASRNNNTVKHSRTAAPHANKPVSETMRPVPIVVEENESHPQDCVEPSVGEDLAPMHPSTVTNSRKNDLSGPPPNKRLRQIFPFLGRGDRWEDSVEGVDVIILNSSDTED